MKVYHIVYIISVRLKMTSKLIHDDGSPPNAADCIGADYETYLNSTRDIRVDELTSSLPAIKSRLAL